MEKAMIGGADSPCLPVEDRQRSAARGIARGACRLMARHGFACVPELTLAGGRRADVVAVSERGDIWILEIKSSLEDFRVDRKWPEYRDYCDRLLFAVAPDFPIEVLPMDAGLILADRFGGEIVRHAPEHRLAGARRKAVTLRFARAAAVRLAMASDPEAKLDWPAGD